MEVEVELSRIIINETADQQIIVLSELDGDRCFPIVIGMPEILAIDRRLKQIELPRPMTHDLLAGAIAAMGGRIERVVISDLSDHTFYAVLHIDANGEPFRDKSFGKKNMGCPFAIEHRRKIIRERIEWYADAYAREGLTCDFVFADWEIDGPLEWNGAWDASKKCRRCRANIPDIDSNFLQFQKVIRDLRSDIQNDVYAKPLLSRFPDVLVGNYALYPHDGFRYWYDYFERYVPGQPAIVDQKARYRHWANDFESTGYTFAMPTVYPWSWTWQWYDFEPGDYRWFYNMLKVAGNAGRHTPHNIPIISFVHWHTVMVGQKEDRTGVQQFSERNYQELLWHMLLRGHDTFFLWCAKRERAKEVRLLHPVWAAAQQYGEFLENGVPICFDIPRQPGPVISGLRLGDRVLVRRTDFTDQTEPVEIKIGDVTLTIPHEPGKCRIVRF